jgi:hypothetical protein
MRPGSSWLGALLLLVSAVGCTEPSETVIIIGGGGGGGSSGGGSSGAGSSGAGTGNLGIEGFWAIYANDMDGTVVSLQVDGNAITGRGCVSGWSAIDHGSSQCGAITGTVEGNQVNFEFYFGEGLPWDTYGVSVQALASGARMNGEHYYYGAGSPTPSPGATKASLAKRPATLFRPPLPPEGLSWPWFSLPQEVTSPLVLARGVTLLGDAPAGKFSPGTSYRLATLWGGLQGDLGLFAPVDVTYEYPETGVLVIHAGPVAQLDPDGAVSLEIQVRDGRVVSIEAELATGEKPTFAPLSRATTP